MQLVPFIGCALALCLAGCRSPSLPIARPAPATATSAPVTVAAPVAIAAPPPADPLPWLARLTTPVCSVPAASWSGDLRLRPGGEPYAHVLRGPAVISLGGAANDGVSQAAVESAGLRVLGVVDHPNVYLTKPTLLSNVVVPRASTAVDWHETTTADRVVVAIDVSDVFEAPKAAEAVVTCEALTATEPAFDARAFAAPPARKTASLSGESTLVAWIGERNGVRIKLPATRSVEVVATRGDMTRIVIETQRYIAVGWLPTVMLGDWHVMRAPVVRMGATSYRSTGERRCAHDLALIASVAGERAFVGTLPAGGSYTPSTLDVEPGFVELALFEPWFQVLNDAKILVRADDLSGC